MSESKHTKGPWHVGTPGPKHSGRIGVFCGEDAPNVHDRTLRLMAEIWEPAINQDAEANAYLIAAAPELLEALERLVLESSRIIDDAKTKVFNLQELADADSVARAAIAKAKGDKC